MKIPMAKSRPSAASPYARQQQLPHRPANDHHTVRSGTTPRLRARPRLEPLDFAGVRKGETAELCTTATSDKECGFGTPPALRRAVTLPLTDEDTPEDTLKALTESKDDVLTSRLATESTAEHATAASSTTGEDASNKQSISGKVLLSMSNFLRRILPTRLSSLSTDTESSETHVDESNVPAATDNSRLPMSSTSLHTSVNTDSHTHNDTERHPVDINIHTEDEENNDEHIRLKCIPQYPVLRKSSTEELRTSDNVDTVATDVTTVASNDVIKENEDDGSISVPEDTSKASVVLTPRQSLAKSTSCGSLKGLKKSVKRVRSIQHIDATSVTGGSQCRTTSDMSGARAKTTASHRPRPLRKRVLKGDNVLLRENLPDSHLSKGKLKLFKWTRWARAIVPDLPKTKQKSRFAKCSNYPGYRIKTIFNGDSQKPAIYEFAVQGPGSATRRKHVVYFRKSTGYKTVMFWDLYQFRHKTIQKEIDRAVSQGCSIWIRRGVLKSHHRASWAEDHVIKAGVHIKTTIDYAWKKYLWRKREDGRMFHRAVTVNRKNGGIDISYNDL